MIPTVATGADTQLFVFSVDHQRCGVALPQVDRVLRMVALAPLPQAPGIILGVFDLHGEILPVASVRRRLGLPERPVSINDRLLIVRTRRRRLALAVDSIGALETVAPQDMIPTDSVVPGLHHVRGITRLPDGLVVVHDMDAFLSLEEETQTAAALAARSR